MNVTEHAASVNAPRPEKRPARLANLDVGRMAACSAVILHHANRDVFRDRIGFLLHGELGVQFFMILSGYLLTRAHRDRALGLADYLRKRAIRILPAYYAAVLGVSALILLGLGSRNFPLAPEELPWHVVSHLLLIHAWFGETAYSLVSVWWSMSLEWQYYMIFPLLLPMLARARPFPFLAIVTALSLGYRAFILARFPGQDHLLWGIFAGRMTEFAAGMALATLIPHAHEPRARLLGARLFAGACGLALACLGSGAFLFRELGRQSAVFAVFLGFLLLLPAIPRTRLGSGFAFLGEASYSTYLIHTLAGKALLAAAAAAGLLAPGTDPGFALGAFFLLAYFVVGHGAGTLCYLFVERPASRALSAIGRRS
ncbi:MAG: acyltransferase [Oligoflexia bacterium]|nr:acyltransferase [Oligoflexia bacterium]